MALCTDQLQTSRRWCSVDNRGGDWREWSQHVLFEIQRLSDSQERMNQTLAENTKQLEIHIQGVKLAREQNEILRADFDKRVDATEADITPLQDHVKRIENVSGFFVKALLVFSTIVGLIIALLKGLK